MATLNSHEASPSTTSRWSNHVFVSFMGEDALRAFTARLFHALFRAGLRTFHDDFELEGREEYILSGLQKAIEGSRVFIIILSKNYASSRWCLEELVMILKRRSSGHLVLPVFYDVDPSEVRTQTGSLKEAFMRHERRIEMEMEMGERKENLKGKVQNWRMALKEIADLPGFQISSNTLEAEIIQGVCFRITKFVATKNRAHPGRQDRCDFSVSRLEEKRRGKRNREEISSPVFSFASLQQHFGKKRKDAAESLGISVSTLKRRCRYHGISRWPYPIRNNAVYSEIEAARGSSKRVFQLEGQTTQSTNREGISSHVLSSEILQLHFRSKRADAAKKLGICVAVFKRVCTSHGIPRWPNRKISSVSGLPNPYGEKNPLPTFNTLSTNGQITMENEVGGQNLEPNECLPDSFEDPNFQNTRVGSIAEFDKTPILSDSLPGPCRDAEFCFSAVYSETEAAGGSSEWVFQLEGQTTQYTAYSNSNAPVFPQPHIASEEVLNENGGSSEDRRDSLASQAEASFEGHVSESSNLTVIACSDAAAPNQTLAMMPIPHLTGGSSKTFQLEKEMGGQIPEPKEFLPDSYEDQSFWNTGHDSIVENGKTLTFHDSFLGNYCDVDICFSSVYNETEATEGSSKCAFQLQGQTTQFPANPIPDDVSQLQIASSEVLSENMGNSEDGRILLASHEASQEEAFLEGHVFESNNLTVPACSDAAAPSRPLATILHTMPTNPHMVPHLIGGSSEWAVQLKNQSTQFPTYPNLSGLVDPPHPQRAPTQIPSENMRTLEDLSILLVPQKPFMEEYGFGSINQTIPSCSNPTPSQQLMMPPLIASQDTSSVMVKATYGHTKIGFKLSFASGIIQLKEEVSKRLEFEPGSFNLECNDADGDWILITCDDNVRQYLQLVTLWGNQVIKLFVLDKVLNTTKFWDNCGCDYCTLLRWKIPTYV